MNSFASGVENTPDQVALLNSLTEFLVHSPIASGLLCRQLANSESDEWVIFKSSEVFGRLFADARLQEPALVSDVFQKLEGFQSHYLSQLYTHPQGEITLPVDFQNERYVLRLKSVNHTTALFYLETDSSALPEASFLPEQMALIGTWVHNHSTHSDQWSRQMFAILMLDEGNETPGFQTLLKFVHPLDTPLVEEAYQSALTNQSGFELSFRLSLAHHKTKYVHLKCFTNYNDQGHALQTIGVLQDISAFEHTRTLLYQSETLFKAIFESAPLAISIVNDRLNPEFVNPQFCRLLGYSADELKALSINDFTHPDDIENGRNKYHMLFQNQIDHFVFTKRYITRQGQMLWVIITVAALKNEQGQNTKAIAMIHDISEQKRANAELARSEQNYRTLIENASDGIGLFDYNFKPVVFNAQLFNMLGYTHDEYLAFDHLKYELFHPDDKKAAAAAINSVLSGKKSTIEKRLRNKNGGYQWFSISYIPVMHNLKPGILIFRRDISKRIEAETEREEYRHFLETIMDNLPVSLFAKTTPDFRYLYWNSTMEKYTGIPAEQAIGATDFELPFFRRFAEQYHAEDVKLMNSKKRLDCEHQLTNTMGDRLYFRTIKTLHNSHTGNPIILGLSMDITRMKEAEQKIDQSNQMLKEAQKIARLGYWEYDYERDVLIDNPENREIFGTTTLNYYLGAPQILELVDPNDRLELETALKNAKNKNMAGAGIIRFINQGQTKHVILNYKPVLNDQGRVTSVRGTSLDITRIRQSEMALRESEARLKQAEQIAKVGYWSYNHADKSTNFSEEVWRILDQEPVTEAVNLNFFFEAVHPLDKNQVFNAFFDARQASQSFNYDFRIITKRQAVKYIKAKGTFIKNDYNELVKSMGTFQDITELKTTELQLQKNTNRLNLIQTISKTGFFEFMPESGQWYFSPSFYKLVGANATKPFTIEQYHALIHPDDRPTILHTFQLSRQNTHDYNIQYRITIQQNTILYVNEICRYDAEGHQFIHVLQDITKIKEVNYALEQASLMWQNMRASAAIGEWTYNINRDTFHISDELAKLLDFKIPKNKLKFTDALNLVHPTDRHAVKYQLLKSFRTIDGYSLKYRLVNQLTQQHIYVVDEGQVTVTPAGEYQSRSVLRNITQEQEAIQELSDLTQMFEVITSNNLFGAFILQNKQHVYANTRWCNLLGMTRNRILHKASLDDLFQPDCAAFINDLFSKWEQFRLREYSNKILLFPKHAPAFEAEVFVKQIVHKAQPAFLILACPGKT